MGNLLSSRLLHTNVKDKIHKPTIISVVLYLVVGKPEVNKPLEDLVVDGRIILKYI
jgi:hypothetical protein